MKQNIREFYKQKRLELTEDQRKLAAEAIFEQIKKTDLLTFNTFHLFLSVKKLQEVDTSMLVSFLWENNKTVVIPKMIGGELSHFVYDEKTIIKENKYGILEPLTNEITVSESFLEVVFVPLLCCDYQGNRLGYGKGFYDKFLLKTANKCKKVGLNYFEPHSEILPTNEWDIPLDELITPNQRLSFSLISEK